MLNIPLHLHTIYSQFDGFIKIKELAEFLKQNGYPGCAITEHHNMAEQYKKYSIFKKNGLKLIHACEVNLSELDKDDGRYKPSNHITLLCKNKTGLYNLRKLLTDSIDYFYRKPTIPLDKLHEYADGIICLSGCPGGIIQQSIINKDGQQVKHAKRLKNIFGDDLYIEMTPVIEGWKEVANELFKVSKEINAKCVSSDDAHYLEREDGESHKRYLSLKVGPKAKVWPTYIGRSNDVGVPDNILKNSWEVFDKCEDIDIGMSVEIPSFGGIEVLKREVNDRYKSRLNNIKDQRYIDRVRHEVDLMEKTGIADYILMVDDICKTIRSVSLLSPGRGSAVSSLVCYTLGITDVDPINYGLIFERFVNPDRFSLPDIDIDIPALDRDKVISLLNKKYKTIVGISTYDSLQMKSALKRIMSYEKEPVADYMSLSRKIIDNKGNLIDDWKRRVRDNKEKGYVEDAIKICGTIITSGAHACGLILSNSDITEHDCLMRTPSGARVIQNSCEFAENVGLLKMDLLGLSTLDVIKGVIDDTKIDLMGIKEDDPKVYKMIGSGMNETGFQLGQSKKSTDLCKIIAPKDLKDVSYILTALRPATLKSFTLDQIKKRDILAYQEEMMQMAMDFAGMTAPQADILRYGVGKKKIDVLNKMESIFFEGAKNLGRTTEEIQNKWDTIINFGEYAFNLAHAAAYAKLCYITTYALMYHGEYFIPRYIDIYKGKVDKIIPAINTAKRFGFTINPPKIKATPQSYCEGKRVYLGVNMIKNVSNDNAQITCDAINVKNWMDFVVNKKINKRAKENVIRSGVFISLVETEEIERIYNEYLLTGVISTGGLFDSFKAETPRKIDALIREFEAFGFLVSTDILGSSKGFVIKVKENPYRKGYCIYTIQSRRDLHEVVEKDGTYNEGDMVKIENIRRKEMSEKSYFKGKRGYS